MCTKGSCGHVLINMQPWLILDQPSIDPWWTLDQHFSSQFVKSQLTLDWYMWLSWHSAYFRRTVDQESTEYQLACPLSVNQDFDWGSTTGRLRVLIDAQPQMHLVNMIFFYCPFPLLIVSGESQKPICIVGLCSRGVLVPHATNFCLWVTGKTYFFQISLNAGHPGFHG